MAKIAEAAGILRLNANQQGSLVALTKKILTARRAVTALRDKMEAIDIAYARYKGDPTDAAAAATSCDIFAQDDVTPPLVVSQVDSTVANWADIYLSGYPIFPVVSTNKTRKWAEQLESIIDDHATIGGYARQILLFLRDGAKYNFGAMEVDWDQVRQFSILGDFQSETGKKVERSAKYYTRIERLDPYNLVFDNNVAPGDVSAKGDYAGYIQILSKIKLKTLLNKYSEEKSVFNADKALEKDLAAAGTAFTMNYYQHPQISSYVTSRVPSDQFDWDAYLAAMPSKANQLRPGKALNYEVCTFYVRLIPSEHGLPAPQPNTPQIWKLVTVNEDLLIHAKRIISANDCLPILVGQPHEDGLGYQTAGVAEGVIEFQEAAKKLFNIRFAAARRAVSDRALYDSEAIRPSDVNAKAPAAKIPVKTSQLAGGKSLEQIYRSIPFDARGTETVLQDATIISEFSKELSGLNNAQRGQFQKGNKSVQEWEDVMGRADGRTRLPAISLEFQIFVPLKQMLLLNIFQYGEDAIVVSQKSGEVVEVDIAELRRHVLAFRLADGHTPKAKMASTETLMAGLNLIMNSPLLQQSYGAQLPAMFAHMMQLGGVRGLEEYSQPITEPALQSGLQTPLAAPAAPVAPALSVVPPVAPAAPI